MQLSGSLVLFQSRPDQFNRAIESFLAAAEGVLWVVDNSPVPLQSDLFSHERVRYMHVGRNIGFGAGHNLALDSACCESELHLIMNPDVEFGPEVIAHLVSEFLKDDGVVAGMPQIRYPDGTLQHLCKLWPTPVDLMVRRFVPFSALRRLWNTKYELHDLPQDRSVEVPMLSGCFLMVRSNVMVRVGGFDARYFMYMEDFDLIRRLGGEGRVVYMPGVYVIHGYAKGSYRSWRLLKYHIASAIKYFNKWGWFLDRERGARNKDAIIALRHGAKSEYSSV